MNDNDTDAGGDFFIDFLKTLVALFVFVIFLAVIGGVLGVLLLWFQ
jgi:hypothetical protein